MSRRGKYDRSGRSKDDKLLLETKTQLSELGFDLNEWRDRTRGEEAEQIGDFPRPKLNFTGQLGDVEMGAWMFRAPVYHDRLERFCDTYYRNLAGLRAASELTAKRARGRPTYRYWGAENTYTRKRLNPVITPIGLGYYDMPPGVVAVPYHVAEMAVVALHTYGKRATVEKGERTFMVTVDDRPFGVRDGKLMLPNGEAVDAGVAFDLDRFDNRFRDGYAGNSDLFRMPIWLAIRAYTLEHPVEETLMQALCHLRYFFEWRAVFGSSSSDWSTKKKYKPRFGGISNKQCDVTPTKEKLLLVEVAYERKRMLEITPYEVAKILCPAVLDWDTYDERFGNIQRHPTTRFFSKAHDRMVRELDALRRELEEQLAAEEQ